MKQKFWAALSCYVALAIIGWRMLDGSWLYALWIFLGGLALKTWIAAFRKD